MKEQRVRMFAGPNGSGKSTMLNLFIAEMHEERLGIYLNADDIEKSIKENAGRFSFNLYDIGMTRELIIKYFKESELLKSRDLVNDIYKLKIENNSILFEEEIITSSIASYFTSVIVFMIRHELLKQKKTFTFETVMSSEDKVEFFEDAKSKNIKTYLYYVATDDPIINIKRIENRVSNGGHNVPQEKIISRYSKSLSLLKRAIKASYRSYIYDNSGEESQLIAEINEGKLTFKVDKMPYWFMNALDLI